MLEKVIESMSAKWATSQGWLTYKFVSPAQRGVPDRVFIKGGRVVFIELKTKTGVVGKLQQYVMDDMVAHGAEVHVCRSVEEVQDVLNNEEE